MRIFDVDGRDRADEGVGFQDTDRDGVEGFAAVWGEEHPMEDVAGDV